MRKKKDILATAALLAGELSTVCQGSVARMRDGSTVDVSRYAHGAAAAPKESAAIDSIRAVFTKLKRTILHLTIWVDYSTVSR